MGKTLSNLLIIRLALNDQTKESKMIYIFINTTIQQKQTKQNHNMNPVMLVITTMIQKLVINYHYLRSTSKLCSPLEKCPVKCKIQLVGRKCRDDVMCECMKASNYMEEPPHMWLESKITCEKLVVENQNPSTHANFRACNLGPVRVNFP